jgi:pimeloyl-ACP methyl ester carboxylesterase
MHVPCQVSDINRRAKCHKGKRFQNYSGCQIRGLCFLEPSLPYLVSSYGGESYRLGHDYHELGSSSRPGSQKPMSKKDPRQADLPFPITTENYLEVNGLRIRFSTAGSGPALVLTHGLLGYSFSWRRVIPTLAHAWQVFAPDMPGAGFSECPADLDGRLVSAAGRLLGFLDALRVRSCDLVGSSYGGAAAIILAGLAPSRIRRLVLISPANPWSRNGRRRLALLRQPLLAWLFPKLARAMHPAHRYFVRRMWANPQRITAETFDGYLRPLLQAGIFEHAVKSVRSWDTDMAELEATLPQLGAIPTLLVWGRKDRVVDPASADQIARMLPGAQITFIEGAGHLPYEECPEEFCAVVEEFLRRDRSWPLRVPGER